DAAAAQYSDRRPLRRSADRCRHRRRWRHVQRTDLHHERVHGEGQGARLRAALRGKTERVRRRERTEGRRHLVLRREHLEKALIRWYAGCCKTPIANTVSGRVPFVGLVQPIMEHAVRSRDDVLGPPTYVNGKGAIGGTPPHAPETVSPRFMFRMARRLLRWL